MLLKSLINELLIKYNRKYGKASITHRIVSGGLWSLLGGVGSRLFTIITTIIVARIIGKEGFGEFGLVQSTMGMYGVLAGFGLGSTATRYIAKNRLTNPDLSTKISNLILIVSLITGGLLAIICYFSSHFIAMKALNNAEFTPLFEAGSLLLFYSTLNNVVLGVAAGFESFSSIARINMLQGAATPIVAIPLTYYYGVSGIIASFTINAALGLLLLSFVLKKEFSKWSISSRYDPLIWGAWPILIKYALPAMLSGLMVAPVTWVTNMMLIKSHGGFGELGLFNAANQWRTIIMFLPSLLFSAMLPVMSEVHGRDNQSDFVRAITLNLKLTWAISLPATILVISFARPLAALFGKDYDGTAPIITLLMISCFLTVINNTIGIAIASSGRMWTGVVMNFGWALSLVVSAYFFIPTKYAIGLAIAYLVAYVFHTCWTMLYVEFKLARSSIFSQYKTIILTIIVLSGCVYDALMHTHASVNLFLFLFISTIPAFLLFKNRAKHFG